MNYYLKFPFQGKLTTAQLIPLKKNTTVNQAG